MNDRRRFLKVVGGAALVSALPQCSPRSSSSTTCRSPSSSDSPTGFPETLGMRAEEVPYGCLVRGPGQSLLGRDERGLYALSSLCQHVLCDLLSVGMVSETGIMCRCHGSRYRLDGTRLAGPTQRDLRHLKLTIRADRTLAVDEATTVDANERTPDV